MWRRPRPVLRPKDPDREAKLAARRQLLSAMPDDETAVFMDEVEVHTNPKVGSRWMRRGGQAVVATPGTDKRRVLAGSSHWRTGRVVLTPGRPKEGRTAALFCRHLDDLRRAFRHYRVVHVICDNARVHKPEHARRVKDYVGRWGERVVLHYLPAYAPECNPVERVGWRLHEAVTRNHRCTGMAQLLDMTFEWFAERQRFWPARFGHAGRAAPPTSRLRTEPCKHPEFILPPGTWVTAHGPTLVVKGKSTEILNNITCNFGP